MGWKPLQTETGPRRQHRAGILGGSSHLVSSDRITISYKPKKIGHVSLASWDALSNGLRGLESKQSEVNAKREELARGEAWGKLLE